MAGAGKKYAFETVSVLPHARTHLYTKTIQTPYTHVHAYTHVVVRAQTGSPH